MPDSSIKYSGHENPVEKALDIAGNIRGAYQKFDRHGIFFFVRDMLDAVGHGITLHEGPNSQRDAKLRELKNSLRSTLKSKDSLLFEQVRRRLKALGKWYEGTYQPQDIELHFLVRSATAQGKSLIQLAEEEGKHLSVNRLTLTTLKYFYFHNYHHHDPTTREFVQIHSIIEQLAKQGNAIAQLNLGFISLQVVRDGGKFFNPRGKQRGPLSPPMPPRGMLQGRWWGKPDLYRAIKYLRKAADQGNATAQYALGKIYELGEGTPPDDKVAAYWYQKAAEHEVSSYGSTIAMRTLALKYASGSGVKRNLKKALELYFGSFPVKKAKSSSKAFPMGPDDIITSIQTKEIYGKFVLGYKGRNLNHYRPLRITRTNLFFYVVFPMIIILFVVFKEYDLKRDTTQNTPHFQKIAISAAINGWRQRATVHGDSAAQNNLGLCYEHGIMVEQDFKEAVKWWRKAADQGNAYGSFNLGRMYRDGKGVERDDVKAYAWLSIAALNGHPKAAENKVSLGLTPDQITQAKALMKELLEKNPQAKNSH